MTLVTHDVNHIAENRATSSPLKYNFYVSYLKNRCSRCNPNIITRQLVMDTCYDEDLSENQFLQELQKEYECILRQVIQKGWIICVPCSGSFTINRKYQEDEIQGHILIPKQDLSDTQFNTLNNKEVLLMDGILNVKDGDGKQYSSRLLFEETFYDKDSCKYCVWCIEQPLEASMYAPSEGCADIITNLQEAVNFLQIELLENELCNNLETNIQDFLHVNKDLDCKTLQVQRDLVHKLYTDCLRILLENTALRVKISSSKHYHWNIRVSLETYILYALRDVLLKSLSVCTAVEDAGLNKIMRNLSEIQLNDLRIRSDLHSHIHGGRVEISRLDCFVTVLGKVECLKRTVNYISRGISSVSSDDLLPVLIFLIIKAGLSNWMAQLTFMKQFRFSAISVHEADKADFLITSLEAAIEHIKSGALNDYINPDKFVREFAGTRTCSVIGPSERMSINYLFMCIKKGNISEVERIFTYNKSSQVNDMTFCHPLCTCAACERNWTKYRDLNAYPRDDRGLTALHVAVLYNQIVIVDFLLESNTNVNIADSDGLTALHYACSRGYQNILLQLLHANADPMMIDARKNTPLHLAVDRGHESCVKALLYLSEQIKVPIDVNARNNNGDTSLHYASKWGYGRIVRVLLECGANCKITNKKGQTPLMVTHSKYIAELLECNAAGNIYSETLSQDRLQSNQSSLFQRQTLENENSLHPKYYDNAMQQRMIDRLLAAIVEGDVCLACYYLGLEIYRKRTDTRMGLCHPLCDCERCSAIEESLEQKRRQRTLTINACNNVGETALHVASSTGRTEIVQLLLDAGANVNVVTNSEGRTPLHLACLNGNVNAVKLLLNCATCNIDAGDRNGDTPLHLATRAGNAKLVRLLVRYGANTNIRNTRNMTPLQQMEKEMSNIFSTTCANILKILKQNAID